MAGIKAQLGTLFWYRWNGGCEFARSHPRHTGHICPDCLQLVLRVIYV